MTILWHKNEAGTRYEVRRAGNALRLYSNGVFHSQYNPVQPVAGSVWDMLLVPAFLARNGRPGRVLVLGVGGGAVIRQLNDFLQPDLIVGVELNPVHLHVAKRFFGVTQANVTLLQADALQWLRHYRGPAFDLVVDDLFGECNGQPQRAIAADQGWAESLDRLVSPQGALVSNFDSTLALRRSHWCRDPSQLLRWSQARVLSTAAFENRMLVLSREYCCDDEWQQRMAAQHPSLDRSRRSCPLNYVSHPLW
ncbi:spermidine synthase [Pseudomaricurvus sp. HS19]|uniref:spermidine synthase n=1 Tax=Pseudomaricurvus sp. HS19 TaxID=2692626 RepID=UPI00136F6999|nr:hypothetical protein [Pseudomaricurvus sp. HS19]MYM62304.1 hypothetical protein [Pseudomaricurvus sp. HS19]